MTTKPPTTLLDYLGLATKHLTDRGVDSPRLNAERLLAGALGMGRLDLYLQFDRPLDSEEVDTFREMLRRRGRREPLQYILGHEEFYGREFIVTPDVLIPRPETEILVQEVLSRLKGKPAPSVADVGTGSGCIAISIAAEVPEASVTATDISPAALNVAYRNAKALGLADRVELLKGDLTEPLTGRTFDAIVSNPPYVASGDATDMQAEVRDHEPATALFAGRDGLDVIRRLVPAAVRMVNPGGFLAMEIGLGQSADVAALCREHAPEWSVEIVQDLARIDRIVIATRPMD